MPPVCSRRPQAALEIVNRLREEPALDSYHVLPSVRGEPLDRLGRHDEAGAEFERAAQRTANSRQRPERFERVAACASPR
jgi:RNA polymerase sigma-70 factor (ECF subfamily)